MKKVVCLPSLVSPSTYVAIVGGGNVNLVSRAQLGLLETVPNEWWGVVLDLWDARRPWITFQDVAEGKGPDLDFDERVEQAFVEAIETVKLLEDIK